MTEPRITNVLTPKVADQNAPLSRGEVALKIIDTTQDLQSVRRPLRLDGVISAVSKDGTQATIQTAKGDVTVQLRNNTPVQQGQSVQIDIPAGSPPRQTILRAEPNTDTQNQAPPQNTGTANAPVTQPSQPQTGTQKSTELPQSASGNTTQQSQSGSSTSQLTNTSSSATPAAPPPGAPPPASTTTQSALPPEIRAVLDQSAPQPFTATQATQPAAPLPPNAIVRFMPLTTLPATTDLLPVPTAIQSLIDVAQSRPGLLDFTSPKPMLASDEFAQLPEDKTGAFPTLPGAMLKPGAIAQTPALTSPFDAKILSLNPGDAFKPFTPGTFQIEIPASEAGAGLKLPTPGAIPSQPKPMPILGADVIAITKDHFPIVSLTLPGAKSPQLFMLQFPTTNIEPGTRLEILPQSLPQILPVPGATTTSATAPANPLTGWTWPALDDAVAILTQSMPQAQMAQTLANVLPSPAKPNVIPPAMQFFIAAIQSGDIASWFGDKAISALRRDTARGGDVLTRLTEDVNSLGRSMDTPAQDWKGVAIPLVWQNEIQKIHLYYKHQGGEKQDDEQERGEGSTRFIFDLNLNRLGDIQLDGLMKSRRLDLILRTGTMFSHSMQTAMREKYQNVLESGNLTGDLVFQNRMDQWVKVKVNARAKGLTSA